MQRYRAEHGIAAPWETRERIVVGIAGEKGDEAVIRRAARIAARTPGSDLLARARRPGRRPGRRAGCERSTRSAALVASVGGSFQEIPGEDVPETLLRFARAENATQIVLGASLRGRFLTLLSGKSIPTRVARRAGHMDVHLVSRDQRGRARVVVRPVAGRGPVPPGPGRRASAEAAALTRLAAAALRGHGDPPALLEEIRQMFGLAAVSLLERRPDGAAGWDVVASAGDRPPEGPGRRPGGSGRRDHDAGRPGARPEPGGPARAPLLRGPDRGRHQLPAPGRAGRRGRLARGRPPRPDRPARRDRRERPRAARRRPDRADCAGGVPRISGPRSRRATGPGCSPRRPAPWTSEQAGGRPAGPQPAARRSGRDLPAAGRPRGGAGRRPRRPGAGRPGRSRSAWPRTCPT